LLQVLYSVRSERLLIEQLDYNLLFRWFVGLSMEDAVWDATLFTKNRDRLLDGEVDALAGAGALARPSVERALHGGRDVGGSLGRAQELQAEERPEGQAAR